MTLGRIAAAKARSAVKKFGLGPVQQKLRGKELKKKTTPPKTKVDDTKKVRAEAAKGAARATRGVVSRTHDYERGAAAKVPKTTLSKVKQVPGVTTSKGREKIANSDPVELGTKYSVKELKATEMALKKQSVQPVMFGAKIGFKEAIKTLRQAMEYRQGLKSATASSSARPMSKAEALREKYRRGGGKVVYRKKGKKVMPKKASGVKKLGATKPIGKYAKKMSLDKGKPIGKYAKKMSLDKGTGIPSTMPPNTVREDYEAGNLNVQRMLRGQPTDDLKDAVLRRKPGGKVKKTKVKQKKRSISNKQLDGNKLIASLYD